MGQLGGRLHRGLVPECGSASGYGEHDRRKQEHCDRREGEDLLVAKTDLFRGRPERAIEGRVELAEKSINNQGEYRRCGNRVLSDPLEVTPEARRCLFRNLDVGASGRGTTAQGPTDQYAKHGDDRDGA